ncbi:helix-turn-helix domain-containing protein [Rhizobium leguminosarum]|uniref:helix-turn-helix domain-containing protein n=1 Tax=Rhizobium leguminosarum TaxID=384 RepID=UPI001C9236FB|nr:helix-turn-helix domain-containing protein [Rhizobium leguminosarum]MBY3025434.1 helix-turn-helix transcriptional regulator [Rhizobium leguminosarum]
MPTYRNPHAALYVGQIMQTHLTKSQMSYQELALRLGVSDTKIVSFVTGRHYLPVEFANPTAEALGIDQGELIYSTLQQYFPKAEVDAIW